MTKEEALPILMLLSRLEGWIAVKDTPDFILDQLAVEVDKLALAIKNDKS